MDLLWNSYQQTGKKSETEKTGSPTKPATAPPQKFLLLLQYNISMGVNEMRVKNYRYCVG